MGNTGPAGEQAIPAQNPGTLGNDRGWSGRQEPPIPLGGVGESLRMHTTPPSGIPGCPALLSHVEGDRVAPDRLDPISHTAQGPKLRPCRAHLRLAKGRQKAPATQPPHPHTRSRRGPAPAASPSWPQSGGDPSHTPGKAKDVFLPFDQVSTALRPEGSGIPASQRIGPPARHCLSSSPASACQLPGTNFEKWKQRTGSWHPGSTRPAPAPGAHLASGPRCSQGSRPGPGGKGSSSSRGSGNACPRRAPGPPGGPGTRSSPARRGPRTPP